jgi:AraC-like DNA-binding protein
LGTRPDNFSKAPESRRIASGDGWTVSEVICAAGPGDLPFEERHASVGVAIVLGGTFQYRCPAGRELMTPGSFLLGNAGDSFICGHEHGTGDRCVSFSYTPDFFERLSFDAGGRGGFHVPRLPPIRPLAPLVARVSALLERGPASLWEEAAIQVAARAIQVERGVQSRRTDAAASSLARVTRVIRMLEQGEGINEELRGLARIARLSPYHFLRTFQELTGTTPHQYLLRIRLRRAALRLKTEETKISDIALDIGFGDISNFNRTFRSEFGMSPRVYRSAR